MFEKSNTICEADMRCNWTGTKKAIYIIYYIISAILFYALGPAKNYDNSHSAAKYLWKIAYYREGISRLTNSRNIDDFYTNITDTDPSKLYVGKLIVGIAITIVVIIIPIFLFTRIRDMITQSSLELDSKGLKGSKRTFNSRYSIDIPIDSINTIACKDSFIGKFIYESTMYISSSKGNFVFYGISNADKFINAVQKEIENNKKGTGILNNSNTNNEAIDKITSLKQMLDNNLISQEEFEQKKNDILSKM